MKQINKVILASFTLVILSACDTGKESTVSNLLEVPIISSNFKSQYLNAINQARKKNQDCGTYGYFSTAPLLIWNEKLYNSAYEHSNDMATTNTFSHTGSGQAADRVGISLGRGSSAGERISAYGYQWSRYAENIGAGTNIDTAEDIVSQLIESDGHCANIMNPLLTEVGMAMVKNSNTRLIHFWTQNFGTPLK